MVEEEPKVRAVMPAELGLEKKDLECCICYEKENLQVSKCKHVACKDCWTAWLSRYLECPKCRGRLR